MVEAQRVGLLILGVVAISTMILEMVGPMAVKMSLRAAGELPDSHILFEPHEITLVDLPEKNPCSLVDEDNQNSDPDDEIED